MTTEERAAVEAAIKQILKNKTKEQLIQEHLDLLLTSASSSEKIADDKIARKRGKANANAGKYVCAAEHFIRLTKTAGKPVSAQKLYDSLTKNYPQQEWRWKYNTIRGWHKLMKEVLVTTPLGSGEDVSVDI